MIIIGLLLLIVAAIVGLDILWKNTFQVPDVVLFGQTLGIHSARVFLLAGIIVGAVLMLGIALILGGYAAKGPKHCSVAGNANRISPPAGGAPRGSLPQVSGTRSAPRTPATPAPATTWPAPARPGVRSSPGSPMSPVTGSSAVTVGSASSCSTGAPVTAAQLCLTWRSSYLRLHRATSCPAVAELVLLRQRVLDELERRDPAGFDRWLSTGARAASDPSRYVGRDT